MEEELPELPAPTVVARRWGMFMPGGSLSFDCPPQTLDTLADQDGLFTADQMRAYARQAVLMEREWAAVLCDQRADLQDIRAKAEGNDYASERAIEARGCAAAIRGQI